MLVCAAGGDFLVAWRDALTVTYGTLIMEHKRARLLAINPIPYLPNRVYCSQLPDSLELTRVNNSIGQLVTFLIFIILILN